MKNNGNLLHNKLPTHQLSQGFIELSKSLSGICFEFLYKLLWIRVQKPASHNKEQGLN